LKNFLILLDLNDNQIILEVKEENKKLIEEYEVFILALSMSPKDFMVSQLLIDSFIFRIPLEKLMIQTLGNYTSESSITFTVMTTII
jgi:hypothetical protein